MTSPQWLLLAFQLPTRPSNARVKTWRRLQQIGAVPTRNSVYVLPNTDQCREDFEWIRSEVVASGGEATVFVADALNEDGREDIVSAVRRAREADYLRLKREADRLIAVARGRRGNVRQRAGRAARALRERFNAVEQIDFQAAQGRAEAHDAIIALERLTLEPRRTPARTRKTLPLRDFQRRRWVTRPRPGVDRMSSAWLIRRFIDPRAVFAFVDRPAELDVPFDMYLGEFSHQGPLCTFEVLAQRFGLTDPVVARIGQIVHDLDMKETRHAPPEAPAIGRMIEGLRQVHPDDGPLLEQGIAMFEALARSFSREKRSDHVERERKHPRRRR